MGLDFVDMSFRIEKRFGIHIPSEVWEPIIGGRKPADLTAGEVCDVIESLIQAHRRDCRTSSGIQGVGVLDYARERDRLVEFEGDVWAEVRQLIGDTMAVEPDRISRDTWLIRDLGMS